MTKSKKKAPSLMTLRNRAGYVFSLPLLIGGTLVFIPLMLVTIYMSICAGRGLSFSAVPFSNYKALLDPWFLEMAGTSLLNILADFVLILVFSFFVASMLNQHFKGRTIARIIFFLPVIVSTGIIAQIESETLFSIIGTGAASLGDMSGTGSMDLGTLLKNSGLPLDLVNVLIAIVDKIYEIIISSGVQILIFLSGFQSVSPQLYEAAYVEGCTGWEAFWKITLPIVSPLILVNGIYSFIDSTTKSTNPVMKQVVSEASFGNYGSSSAMAVAYLLVSTIMIAAIFFFINRFVYYQD